MSELSDKFVALIQKDGAESLLVAADIVDAAAKLEEVKRLPTDKALAAVAIAIRNEAGKILSGAPAENLFSELGKLIGEVEHHRILGKVRP